MGIRTMENCVRRGITVILFIIKIISYLILGLIQRLANIFVTKVLIQIKCVTVIWEPQGSVVVIIIFAAIAKPGINALGSPQTKKHVVS